MAFSWAYWMALLAPLGGLAGLWLRYRGLTATVGGLSADLERRNTELEEAHHTLNRLAGIDSVTSLPNHSAFQDCLRGEWRRALREASCLTVLMVDIDHFREYNDRLGHQTGDDCLAKIGAKVRGMVQRPGDLVARYGGEEFAVVMSRTDPQGASLVAHRICAAVESLAIKHPQSDVSPCVTVSIGVCTSTPAIDSNWEELELVAGANRALAQAKREGRNRIAAVEGEPEVVGLE